jgi:hypothetical protein
VPSAKRVRAIRKQRSLVLVGFAIMALLAIVLFLLYKTGQKVTTLPGAPPTASAALGVPPVANPEAPAVEAPRVEDPPAGPATNASASPSALVPAAPRPKASAQSSDIFRKPAF